MSDGYDYDEQDSTFIEDLKNSKGAVYAVTEWLSSKGYSVIVKPTFIRPDASSMAEYSDDGDIEVIQRVEVKHRPEIDFRSKEDFPYTTLIVDVCHAWDNARPKPFAYVICNASKTAAFIVEGKTRRHWKKVKKRDRKKSRDREFYECPMGHIKFVLLQ